VGAELSFYQQRRAHVAVGVCLTPQQRERLLFS
jgi:hypothetical protein